MDVRLASDQASQLGQQEIDQIRKILQDNFKGTGIDQEIQTLNIVPDPNQPNLQRADSAGCVACHGGYAAAVGACNVLPFPPLVAACITAATAAYGGCKERNCN